MISRKRFQTAQMETPTKMAPMGSDWREEAGIGKEGPALTPAWSWRHLNTAMLRHSAPSTRGSGSVFMKPFLELSGVAVHSLRS